GRRAQRKSGVYGRKEELVTLDVRYRSSRDLEGNVIGSMSFDETHNVREAIDFLTDKLTLREKLIQGAKQSSEKDPKYRFTLKRLVHLVADFLSIYQPALEKIAGHKESLQEDMMPLKQTLAGITGMIEVAKGVEVLAERVRELENEAKGIDTRIKERTKAVEKIDYLLSKVKHRASEQPKIDYQA